MITIHVSHPQRADVTRQLVHLAGGDTDAVTAATHGVIVADELALKWLTATRPYTPNGTARRTALAPLVQEAEQRAGIGDPDAARERAPQTTPPASGNGRRTRKTAAPSEEQT